MLSNKLIDGIISEPDGGAHRNPNQMFQILADEIIKIYNELKMISTDELINSRVTKFCQMGVFEEG